MNSSNESHPRRCPSDAKRNQAKKVCSFFAKNGTCKFGEKCRFSHDVPNNPRGGQRSTNHRTTNKNETRKPCADFQRNGSCKYGDRCRFSHDVDQPKQSIGTSASVATEAIGIFEILIRRKMVNCTSKQIAQFVGVCTDCFALPGDSAKSQILQTLSSSDGFETLRNIFGKPKTFVLENSANKMQISLTKDFFPFLRFATSPDVIGSAFQQEVNGFLQSLGSCFDWQEMVLVLDELLFKGEQEQDLFEIVNCFVNFVLELIRRFDDDFFEQVESLLQTLIQLADLLQQENEPTRAQRQLKAAMIELTHSVAQKSSRAEQVEKLTKALEDKAKAQKQKAKAKAAAAAVKKKAFSIECYQVPPGRYRPGGPRHNNDSANIDSINVVPTEEEVLCDIPPYLPPNKAGTVAHLQKGSIEAHRDLHFRLLRHNLIADIKSVLLEFRKDGGIQGLRERDLQMPGLPLKVGPQDIQTDVYRNVQVIRMRAEFTSGVFFDVEFDNLKIIAQKSEYDKSAYWKKSSRLQSGTLACLCWESGVGRELNIVFGTIAERTLPNLCQNRPQIGLKSLLDSYHQKLENLMKPIRYNERRSEIILIQTGPCFYAYQPVLEALKRAPIPLSHYITQPPIERNPLINPLDAFRQPAPRMSCPQYFKRGGYFDLSFLCKNMASSSLKRVRENFFPLNDVVTHSTLDMSQAEALKTALTHELAIVQGPPGTGKTFLALQVMRALLSFTDDDDFGRSSYGQKSLAPILCVCFTNHALDQFLVGLLDAGITGVVRVGGNCKNERLEKFNLKNLEKPNLGKKGYQLRREILPELETKINAISHTEHDLYSVKAPEFSMMEELIRDASSSFFAAIVDSQDFRGEEKSLPPYQAWNKWWDQCPNRNRRTTRSLTTLLELEDIWDLSITEHRRLKTFWTEELRKNISEDSDSLVSRYEHSIQEYQKLQRESNLKCLKNATVIGMTTTYVAKNQQLLAGLKPKVVMLEEAAEVLEAHVLTCLCAQTEHVILIGDHLQLRPKVDQYIMQENSGSGLNLDISLFERLVTQNDIPFATLQTQRRMRPDFSQLIRPTVYPHLTDHESVRRYPSVPGVADNLYFIDHDHKELGAEEGKSHSNEFEAHYAVELAAYLSKHHIFTEEDIAIITPYVGQLLTIKRLLTSTSIPVLMNVRDEQLLSEMAEKDEDGFASGMFAQAFRSRRELNSCVRLATIDNFQGEEAKVIILSLVRNNKQGNIGFLGEKSRINVLLSRAKWGMYLIGNSESLVNCKKSNMWKEVINILKQQNRIGPCLTVHCPYHRHHVKKIAHWKDFRGLGTSGGCQLPCGEQLPCGHICRKRCHSVDREHLRNDCNVLVSVPLPCGHVVTGIPCNQSNKKLDVVCDELVSVSINACQFGHKHEVICHAAEAFKRNPDNCTVLVSTTLPCGHMAHNIPCNQVTRKNLYKCQELVSVTVNACQFGHRHQVQCHKANEFRNDPKSCTAMAKNCKKTACGHYFDALCCEWKKVAEDPYSCEAVCGDKLPCGHYCQSRCGDCFQRSRAKFPSMTTTLRKTKGKLAHGPCTQTCHKQLICGHYCQEPCHHNQFNCGPCMQNSPVLCRHRPRGSRKSCAENFDACKLDCDWECEHRGKCTLPCSAPCNRLPCDLRCKKRLSCGCRCPSICGENCPSSTYCLIHGSASVKQMDVNLSGKRLCDLTDQNLINDPIIVLDCGHVFLTSFLDEVMSLKDFYAKDKRGMWTKPKLGEKFLNFEQRKVCPNCHAPIVNVRRYGRVINKTNLDLMERAFYQKCEERLSTLDKKVERAVITWNNSSQGATASTRSELSKKQSSVLEKIEREYTELLTYTQNPPSNEVHEMTKTRIASLLQDQSLSLEQIKQQMSVIAIPQTDPARQCKALIGHGKCIKEFIYLQIEILKNLERIFPSSQQSAIKSDEMKKAVLDGQNKVTEILATITQSLDQAVQAKNNARIVDATQSALSICSVAFKFTIEAGHFNAANATDIPLSEIDQIVQNQASLIVDMAEKTFNAAVNACTSSSHRNTIRDSRFKLDQMKTALRKLKRSGRSSILESSPLFGYPEVQTSNFRDNINRCPKGHVFTTPYNTEMSSMPCCPDCGVQGQSTSLLSRLVSFIF